jgi:hypothetical protein
VDWKSIAIVLQITLDAILIEIGYYLIKGFDRYEILAEFSMLKIIFYLFLSFIIYLIYKVIKVQHQNKKIKES